MEIYVAVYDYEKEREDVLSFKKGDKFEIASKADNKWWAAYAVETREYGYIPSKYVEQYVDPSEGKEAQRLLDTPEGATKKTAMAELMRKIPRVPASSGPQEEEDKKKGNVPVIIKPLSDMVHIPDDCVQIEPKKLANPHLESKQHKDLNREIRFNSARGGAQNLGKPELEKVMQRRKPDADGNVGSIRPTSMHKPRATSPGGELGEHFARRTRLLEQHEKEKEEEENKPEFAKISLRKAQQC